MNSTALTIGKAFLFFIFCLFCFQACDSGTAELEKEQLIGNWLFEEGTIDGGETGIELLKNLNFNFTETEFSCQILSMMMPGFSQTEPYTIEEQTIVVNEQLRLLVKELDAGKLRLSFDIEVNGVARNYDLLFSKVLG